MHNVSERVSLKVKCVARGEISEGKLEVLGMNVYIVYYFPLVSCTLAKHTKIRHGLIEN